MTDPTRKKCIARLSRCPPGGQLWKSSRPSEELGPTPSFLIKLSSRLESQGCLVGPSRAAGRSGRILLGPVEQGNPYTGAFTRKGEDVATRTPPADLGQRPGPSGARMGRGPQVGYPLAIQQGPHDTAQASGQVAVMVPPGPGPWSLALRVPEQVGGKGHVDET